MGAQKNRLSEKSAWSDENNDIDRQTMDLESKYNV